MEDKPSEVVLFGTWYSSYTSRVALALKLKGIPFKYVEENLSNKSELLLKFNPIHKKVPVLLHNGMPICESLIILEYIDEVWNHAPKLLPEDPYQRARVRFWTNYTDQKIMPACYPILLKRGEENQKAIEDMEEMQRVLEEGIKQDFPEKSSFFNGKTMGLLDIVMGVNGYNYKAFHEVTNSEIIGPKNPKIFMWVNALKEHPLMKDTLPPHDKVVAMLKSKIAPTPDV
ncbi:hypothetical protein PIB30_051758 [Stylosanthes scabra]|uniref:Glutathione S-transferase n=1 Tax=Stylosanthes scabra TaxID=79078 RepID=A0ABU6VGX0_9FABA|nr:hypothetical protein [Stylosanthes scabra]